MIRFSCNCLFEFVEWQSDDDEPAVKGSKKSACELAFKHYYEKLKASIKDGESTAYQALSKEQLSNDKNRLLEQVKSICIAVESYKRQGWEHFVSLGYALATLKRLYFTVCFQCKPLNPDMFVILSCKKCVKASNGNTFFADVEKKIDYDKGHINFLITVAGLATKFRKLMQTPYNSGELKKYMVYLPDQLKQDRHIWI